MHLINLFQTDSFYFPSSYSKQNSTSFYYNNYYYGKNSDKNSKLKLNKILSNIIEEEEKSKAAGPVNNSLISEEEMSRNKRGKPYSHFFMQSIKYGSNYLQSIFNDKKKAMYFHFLKSLKKIKNEAFLRGLINQKKNQTLNQSNNDEKDKNNYSEDNSSSVILYNANDNFNMDNNYLENKNNDKKKI